MLASLNRALQVQVADALRARLPRSAGTGLPLVEALTADDQRDLSAAGAGRLAAVAIRIGGGGGPGETQPGDDDADREAAAAWRDRDEPGVLACEKDGPGTVRRETGAARRGIGAARREVDGPGSVRRAVDQPDAVLREVAWLVQEHVRRTDVLLGLASDTLLVLAPGLDAATGYGLAGRLERLLAERGLRAAVGVASRSPASHPDWTPQSLAGEAQQRAC